ncbi:Calcium-activated chloride channel [Popillia japonica]|uniref:Anoctamin n=1 Tax=Popillia japonica TaxID=7064 RepID=A0AAW1N2J8_POPJA
MPKQVRKKRQRESDDDESFWRVPRTYRISVLREHMEKVLDNFTFYDVPDPETADFVLTYTTHGLKGSVRQAKIGEFLQNLRDHGLVVRKAPSVLYPDLVFVLITGSNSLLKQYAESFGIMLSCDNPYHEKEQPGLGRALECRVHTIDVNDPEFARAPATYSGERPTDITVHEKIMDGYPLHHAQVNWTEEGALSDRQILARYWANPKYFFQRQPINLIEKYFGAEVAFYFAFLGHLIFILWWAAGLGLFCFVYGLMTLTSPQNYRSFETCASKLIMCPTCTNFEVCKYVPLMLISIWTTVSMELWKRRQAALAYRWNVFSAHIDLSMRPEYAMTSHLKRFSVVTGEWEPYEDSKVRYTHLFVSYSVVILLAVLAISVIVAIRLYLSVMRKILATSKVTLFREYSQLIAPSTASLISVTIMLLLETIYVRLAKVLTELENPRTETQYDNSLIYKRFALTFINGYAVTIYIAFFQVDVFTN